MTYNYLPDDNELPNESKLKGIYRVSFDIQLESQDDLSVSDVTQALTEGFERGFGDGFVNKVADLSIEKITKKAQRTLKVGDKIKLVGDVNVEADIYSDDGYIFIGTPSEISEKVTDAKVKIQINAGSTGYINKIHKDGSFEIADIDKPYVNPLWEEIGLEAVNIDLITVKAEQIEKIDIKEVQ
jgi:hypothetical protein